MNRTRLLYQIYHNYKYSSICYWDPELGAFVDREQRRYTAKTWEKGLRELRRIGKHRRGLRRRVNGSAWIMDYI